ncbi:MAG: FAD-dependent oxidoreductase [Vicinamibacterales bacterium]|nr:FAD-dependent oxidoreductase [Vicinamibacterales bacterium]
MATRDMDSGVSRRHFLGGTVAGVAAGAWGGALTGTAQAQTAVQEIRTDVVICGSGIGGLTAAVRAQQAGANVIVLEKAYEPGGTTAHSEGGVWTSESYEDMRETAPNGDPVVQRTIFDNLPRAFDFYDELGAPLGAARPGRTRSRSIPPVAWVNFMVGEFERGGGTLMVETAMLRLLTNRQYEVIGVLAEGEQGLIRILARAVVLATGGWAGSAQLVTQNITRYFGSLHQRNASFGGRKPLLTGDGFWAASQIGAAPTEGGWDSFYGHGMPARPTKQMQNPLTNFSLYHGNWSVVVNLRGRRFADETQGKQAGTPRGGGEQLINQEVARQPEATAAYIWDEPVNVSRACAECGLGDIDKFTAFKDIGAPVAMANTLGELTAKIEAWGRGMPAAVVSQQLDEYNTAAKNGKAWALPIPKTITEQAVPLQQPPYYAVLMQTGITATYGGLRVNAEGQVLSRTLRPIRGLYAAGVDIGNHSNYVYLGNLGVGATFGYISGPNAAKQPEPQGGWETGPLT